MLKLAAVNEKKKKRKKERRRKAYFSYGLKKAPMNKYFEFIHKLCIYASFAFSCNINRN